MSLSKESIGRLLGVGSNVRMKMLTRETMVGLAMAANSAGVNLTIVGTIEIDGMLEIAHAGGKYVTFDVTG